jgi:hypothetical protein
MTDPTTHHAEAILRAAGSSLRHYEARTREAILAAVREAMGQHEALIAALAKVMPIRVHDGQDYAEAYFSDGTTHSTHAMTMNPQDWQDIAKAFDALPTPPRGE